MTRLNQIQRKQRIKEHCLFCNSKSLDAVIKKEQSPHDGVRSGHR